MTTKSNNRVVWTMMTGMGLLATLGAIACGKSSNSSPTASSPTAPSTSGPTVAATITIGANGVASPNQPQIAVGQQVRFVNNDSKAHDIRSGPHPTHTDCPPTNNVGVLQPGASGTSAAYTKAGTCSFHDNLDENNKNLQGVILVGVSEPSLAPPGGYY